MLCGWLGDKYYFIASIIILYYTMYYIVIVMLYNNNINYALYTTYYYKIKYFVKKHMVKIPYRNNGGIVLLCLPPVAKNAQETFSVIENILAPRMHI